MILLFLLEVSSLFSLYYSLPLAQEINISYVDAIFCFMVVICCSEFTFIAGTVIKDEAGLTLDKANKEVLGHASKVVLTKDITTIVGDGSTQ